MDNKGFTLIELLAVITIISLLTIVAVPSALTFQENMKKKMFCTKVETIERAARLYGEDVKETIKGDKIIERKCSVITKSNSESCQYITINTLLAKGYLKKEANAIRKDDRGKPIYDEFYDPRTFASMKNDYVIVFIENERAYARYVYKNLNDSEFCNKEDAEKKAIDPSKKYGYYYEEPPGSVPDPDNEGEVIYNEHGKVSFW